jgi:mannose-6-phosphate isomerase-like protein (cupin superfamily)
MDSFYDLDNIVSAIEKDDYFVDFLNTRSLTAGIIRLRADQKDTQTSHPLDEMYYVIKGEGQIRLNTKDRRVGAGTILYIQAGEEHNFHGNQEDLIVFYVFSKSK